ncbi:MAG: AMP-binding protein, partial [Actinomycetota bacterium]|nr:AMP-binding protein [Actinomycetota bacterium]
RTLDAGRRYVSLVPTQLSRLLDDAPAAAALTRFDAVLLGGGAVAPRVLARAGALGIGLRTTYGMSETAGGCFYDGLPLPGAGATIEDGGRIVLSGPMLARRYRGDPGATSAAFVDGRFRSADAGRFTADGRLQVLGRLDDVIVTGGRKVHPLEVQEVLGRVPQVVEAFVAGVPDAQWGQAVTAWVVPHPGVARDGLLDTLRAAVRLELGPPAVPKAIRLVEEIPRLTSGKTDRRRLVDEASAGGAHRPGA